MRLNSKGISITEVLIASVLLVVLTLITVTAIRNGLLGVRGVNVLQAANSSTSQIRQYLWKSNICTGNFLNQVIVLNQPIEVLKIEAFNDKIQDLNTVLYDVEAAKDKETILLLNKIQIIPLQKLSKTAIVGEVRLSFKAKGESVGTQALSRNFPLAIVINETNQKLIQCGSLDGTAVADDRICAVSSGGHDYYDPIDKVCKSRFEEKCFMGSGSTAACPAGWSIVTDPKKQNCVQQGADTPPQVTRSYTGLGAVITQAPAFQMETNATAQSGICHWATDLDPTGWICGIRCERQIKFD